MADIPAEAVQAAANAALAAQIVREASAAGVGSPASCPSVAPESTQSPATTSVAPVYPPGPVSPAETLSAPRGEHAHQLANSHASEHAALRRRYAEALGYGSPAWQTGDPPWLLRPTIDHIVDAVLAVRDDELSRALRIADYHADLHRQAVDAIARVRAEHAAIHAEMDEYAHTHEPSCECEVIPTTRETADRMLAALDGGDA